jgi:hypothetical protein
MKVLTIVLFAVLGSPLPMEPVLDPSTEAGTARYYVVLFGGESERWCPRTGHVWATYVRATPQQGGTIAIEAFSIGWLPTNLNVRPFHLRPESGRNFTLRETLDHMVTGRHDISMWGPFETAADFYWESARYKQLLDSGAMRYRVFDRPGHRTDVDNCVHAITGANPALESASDPILWYGTRAAGRVANAMAKVGIVAEPTVTHDWLIPALGIDHYGIDRKPVWQRSVHPLRLRR